MCASTSKSGTRPLQLRKCRAVYSTSATRELAKIAGDLEDAGQSRSAALAFTDRITDYCEHLAQLPGLLGRARPELRPEYRSVTFASYVIFFRYVDGSAPREVMEIIHLLHGARDIEAFFPRTYDDS